MARTALVTGGTGGLGVAVTTALRDAGWQVVVPWVTEKELDRLGDDTKGIALVRADLTDPDSVRDTVATAGPDLRAVVNLVGGFAMGGKVHETPVDDFEAQLRLNLRPTYLVCQAAIPVLIGAGGGSVVCVSAQATERPFAGAAGYVTAKTAILGLVAAMHVEYAQDGVRVNAILPLTIDTPRNRASQPDADFSKWTKPADIASTVAFLCGDDSRTVAGARIPV
jgi:NAD(P)-dependent dehydrogenase (short-subunit alcohol dehydrogenase family)